MRRSWPALFPALAVGAALFLLLAAVRRETPAPEDPWLEAWQSAGLQAQWRDETGNPSKTLQLMDARPLTGGPEFQDTRVRSYFVQSVSAQVVIFPSDALLPEIPEGRHKEFRLKKKGGSVHLCRAGRKMLLLSVTQRSAFWASPVPGSLVDQAFDAFEEAAGR